MTAIDEWLALVIGNSRLHWAWFVNSTLHQTWHTPHLSDLAIASLVANQFNFSAHLHAAPTSQGNEIDLWLASVVPQQTERWSKQYPNTRVLTLPHVPLARMYASFGLDRALAVWGAIERWGTPVLVIDAGTALTITGADQSGLRGGAILPGLQLQMRSLFQSTASLPEIKLDSISLPPRWGRTTPEAIQSGVIYSTLAGMQDFITDWQQRYPAATIVLTGGDGALLFQHLQRRSPVIPRLTLEPNLIFWGMQRIRAAKH